MAGSCPTPGPDDPLVRGLMGVVDCNVEGLVHGGYAALFQAGSPLTTLLTALLTIYVAFIGFGLMLGRIQLRVSDLVLTVVKLGIVLALATQWDLYQALVYRALFDGPRQLADGLLSSMSSSRAVVGGDVFDGLQLAFDRLNAAATAYGRHAPGAVSPFMGGPASGAALLTMSAGLLVLSSLGVLLASKLVLALLLAIGPLFIALLLFDSTRGLFEGWLRATLAFAFAPLATILLLGVSLTLLASPLDQLTALGDSSTYPLGPVYSVAILVLVFSGVSAALLVAGGMIAKGFKLPRRAIPMPAPEFGGGPVRPVEIAWMQPRPERIAAAAAMLERREAATRARTPAVAGPVLIGGPERTTTALVTSAAPSATSGRRATPEATSLDLRSGGEPTRRSAGPRATRAGRGAPA